MPAPLGNQNAVGNSGRPTVIDVMDVNDKFDAYIKREAYPVVKEFTGEYGISSTRFYELKDNNVMLKETLKKAIDKAEVYLSKYSTNTIKDIFTLKQKAFGWQDKQEIETSGNISINISMPRPALLPIVDDTVLLNEPKI